MDRGELSEDLHTLVKACEMKEKIPRLDQLPKFEIDDDLKKRLASKNNFDRAEGLYLYALEHNWKV